MQPKKKFQLKEIVFKVSQVQASRFDPHKAEWTLGPLTKPPERQATSPQPQPANNLPLNSALLQSRELREEQQTRLTADIRQVESKKAEALRQIHTYEAKISKSQHELKQVQEECSRFTKEWALEKSRHARLSNEIDTYKKMTKSKR